MSRFESEEAHQIRHVAKRQTRELEALVGQPVEVRSLSCRPVAGGVDLYGSGAFGEIECAQCGFDEHEALLDVHHRDGDHGNDTVENLQVLCVMCHARVTRLGEVLEGVAERQLRQAVNLLAQRSTEVRVLPPSPPPPVRMRA